MPGLRRELPGNSAGILPESCRSPAGTLPKLCRSSAETLPKIPRNYRGARCVMQCVPRTALAHARPAACGSGAARGMTASGEAQHGGTGARGAGSTGSGAGRQGGIARHTAGAHRRGASAAQIARRAVALAHVAQVVWGPGRGARAGWRSARGSGHVGCGRGVCLRGASVAHSGARTAARALRRAARAHARYDARWRSRAQSSEAFYPQDILSSKL